MTVDSDDTDAGRGALRPHLGRAEPPPELAARVRETLEARGLVRSATGLGVGTRSRGSESGLGARARSPGSELGLGAGARSPGTELELGAGARSRDSESGLRVRAVRAALLAAGVLLGVVGRGVYQEARESGGTAGPASAQYVLVLYGDTPGDTGAVHIAREREYGRWASALGDGARWVGGHELHDVVARLGGGASSADAASERVVGFFVIEARSRAQAAEVARTCPHVRYGGRVVVMTVAS